MQSEREHPTTIEACCLGNSRSSKEEKVTQKLLDQNPFSPILSP